MSTLHELSAAELLAGYRQRQFSPVEVARDVLEHIARWEPHLAATWLLRPEAALAQARASEARWLRGAPCGLLDGVPATLKDNIATAGDPTPLGTAAVPLVPASADAPPAARLREAGAVLIAKTTMPDYGMLSSGLSSFHALARNPWDLSKGPGGSSAGAGAAAAAGYGPLHVGTDIGGSIRLPASWCGIFGLKPSLGRVPIDPPYTGRAAGPMTRTVQDAALMMQVLSRPDARDSMSLPPQDIDWLRLAPGLERLRGLRLLLDELVHLLAHDAVLFGVLVGMAAQVVAHVIAHRFQCFDERRQLVAHTIGLVDDFLDGLRHELRQRQSRAQRGRHDPRLAGRLDVNEKSLAALAGHASTLWRSHFVSIASRRRCELLRIPGDGACLDDRGAVAAPLPRAVASAGVRARHHAFAPSSGHHPGAWCPWFGLAFAAPLGARPPGRPGQVRTRP